MKRGETVALLKELGAEHLIQPSLVLIQQRTPDNYQLQIRGNYDFQQIEMFVKNRFALEESNGYLIFYKPSGKRAITLYCHFETAITVMACISFNTEEMVF